MAPINNTDWEYEKPVEVNSSATSPGSEKVQPLILDGSEPEGKTGTGSIGYDTGRIDTTDTASKLQSFVITGPSGDETVPYEVENPEDLGTTNEVVAWVYSSSFAADDSVHFNLYFGGGDGTDYSFSADPNYTGDTGPNPWGQTGINAELVQHFNDDPLTATDSSPNGNDGTVNGATATTGEFDGAGSFDGNDNYIDIGGALGSFDQLTAVFWVNLPETDADELDSQGHYWDVSRSGEFDNWMQLSDGSGGTTSDIRFGLRNTGGTRTFIDSPSGILSDNTWHQVAGTWDGSTMRVFSDTSQQASGSLSGTVDASGNPQYIASREGTERFINGTFDAFRFYTDSKSEDWFQADYDASPKGGQIFFSAQAGNPTTANTEDWNEQNTATVGTLSDSSSFADMQKVQYIKATEGTGSGTGDVQFSSETWDEISNLSNPEEGFVVLESDGETPKAFEIESVDTANRVAHLWVYGSWDSDDSDQVVVAAGTGDGTDYSMDGEGDNPWGQTGVNAEMVQHLNDDPLTATDSSPNGNDGTVNDASATSSGQFDGAGSFDGSDDYIGLPNLDLSNEESFSISLWFKTSVEDNKCLLGQYDGSSQLYQIFVNDAGEIQWRIGQVGDNEHVINSAQNYSDDTWHNILVVYDASGTPESTLYYDGNEVGTASGSVDPFNFEGPYIGARSDDSSYFSGEIDAVKTYKPDSKSANWMQADFDASPKGGQTFFSWSGPESTTGTTVSGTVTDNDGNPVQNAEVYIVNSDTDETITKTSTDSNGDWTAEVSSGITIHATTQNPNNTDQRAESQPFIEVQ